MKTTQWLFTGLTAVLLAGCSAKHEAPTGAQVTGIPIQTEDGGKWGMLSPTGEVIFEDEFENNPFLSFDDRFFVEEGEGLHALYTLEESPQKLDEGFIDLHSFIDGRALVVKPGEHIKLIDTDGNVIKTLDEAGGKEIDKIYVADDGLMRFETTDHYWGLLDADGEVLLEPEYGVLWYKDGTVLTNPMSEQKFYYRHIPENMTDHIMNIQGEELGTVKGSRYITSEILDGGEYLACYKAQAGKKRYFGILDTEGKIVIKPSKEIREVGIYRNQEYTFSDGSEYGLMNMKGEVIIEPQYDKLWFWGDNLMLAGEDEGDDDIIGTIIDKDGKKVGKEEFTMKKAVDFPRLGNEYAMVQMADGFWTLGKQDGTLVEDLPDIADITTWTRVNDYVQSSYIDPERVADKLKITAEGIDGLTVYVTPSQFVDVKEEELTDWLYAEVVDEDLTGKEVEKALEETPITSHYYYEDYDASDTDKDINLEKNIDGMICYITPYFREGMTKKVGDETVFINTPTKNIECYIPSKGKARGHLNRLFKAFAKRIRPFGETLAESNGYLCIWTKRVLIELRKDPNRKALSLYYTRVPVENEPNMSYIRQQAQERTDITEDCPMVIED